MKTSQRITSIFLALLLLVSSVPFAFAQTEMPVADNSDISLQSSNALGRVLASALNEESEDDGTVAITGLSVNEKTATVSLKTDKEATAVVAIYDESGLQMLASGKQAVAANDEEAVVTIETDTMPEYYTAKAFLLDADYHALCEAYISKDNTRAYEEFMAKTTDDFEQNLVVNFDESEDTNFAVLTDDSVIAETSGDKNVLVNADDDALTYTFSHIDGDIRDLAKGDVFFYESDETAIALKVDSVSISGDTATIQAQEDTELADVFDFVKIEAEHAVTEDDMKNATFGEGVTYLGATKPANGRMFSPKRKADVDIDVTNTIKYNFELHYQVLNASFELAFTTNFKIYYDVVLFGKDYVDADVSIQFAGKVSVQIGGKIDLLDKIDLVAMDIPIGGGLFAELRVRPAFEASASVSAEVSISSKYGFTYTTGSGLRKIKEVKSEPEYDINSNISLFVGIKPSVSVSFCKLVRVEVGAKVGAEANGTLEIPAWEDGDSVKHDCKACVEGIINLVIEVSAALKLGTEKLYVTPVKFTNTFRFKLGDFYWSVNRKEFGFSTCPHKEYLVTFTIKDELGEPIENAKINYTLTTNKDGKVSTYLSNAAYEYIITSAEYPDRVFEFVINGEPKDFVIDLSLETNNTSGIKKVGSCGTHVNYTLYNDGQMIISGEGPMNDGWFERYNDYGTPVPQNAISVIVQDGVTRIGDYAFFKNTSLESIRIANSVKSIGDNAFSSCSSLQNIKLPRNLESVGSHAFGGCVNITEIKIPATTETFSATNGCTALTSISVDPNNPKFKSIDGALFSKDGKTLYWYPGGKKDSFYAVPDTVETIGSLAFYDASYLLDLTFPDTISTIGVNAFPSNETCLNLQNGANYIGKVLYKYKDETNSSINGLNIKSGTTGICSKAFYGARVARVQLPDSLKWIGDEAFHGCGLAGITLPNQLETIGNYAFLGNNFVTVDIPDSVISIGSYAFSNCGKLKEINLSHSISSINDYTFSDCSGLETITLPDSIVQIEAFAFKGCKKLESIQFPESVSSIKEGAVSDCDNIKSVYIANPNCSLAIFVTYNFWNEQVWHKAISNGTVYGYTGSTAEVYAQEAGLPFVAIDAAAPAPARNAPARAAANRTATFDHAVKGEQYVFLAVKDKAADDLLAADNLLYIDQTTAGSSKVSFTYLPKDGVISLESMILGMCSHSFISYPLSEATCSAEGEEMLICEYCGSIEKKPIPMKPHAYTTSVTEATCTEDGQTVYTCPDCGDTYTEPVFATGHAWGDWVIVKPATETEEGLMERVCQNNASHKETKPIEKLQPHTHTPTAAVHENETEAACSVNGSYDEVIYCAECGEELSRETITIPATGNHEDKDNDGKCDTCGEKMTGGKHCKYCGKIHGGAFGWLVKFFHSIFAIFKR